MIDSNLFKNPPRSNSPAVFWFWNDEIQPDEVNRQLNEMCDKGVYEVVIHARIGLVTPYLSDQWMDCVDSAVKTAKKLNMKLWIYDENNFPSGYAGGLVLKENSDYCGKHLKRLNGIQSVKEFMKGGDPLRFVAAYNIKTDTAHTSFSRAANEEITEDTVIFIWDYTYWRVAFDDSYYIDVLNPKATQSFILHTHEKYRERFVNDFGSVIAGFFSDEAGMYQNLKCFEKIFNNFSDYDTIAWTNGFADYYEEVNGYRIEPFLNSLWQEGNDKSIKYKYDYYKAICSLYIKSFLLPQRDYCHRYSMKFIGHLHMEDYLRYHISTQGDFAEALDVFDYAGLDRIAYSPNNMTEKLVSSFGHVRGKEHVMSESFACAGWDITPADLRRWTDFQLVRGVDKFILHAFFYSVRELRKTDCPPSYFEQNFFWENFNIYSYYVSRLSNVLTQGRHVADVAVYYPMETAYKLYTPQDPSKVDMLQQIIDDVGFCLLNNQQDFDFINETVLNEASAKNGRLCICDENYRIVIFPMCTCLSIKTIKKIRDIINLGVKVVFLHEKPSVAIDYKHTTEFKDIISSIFAQSNVFFLDTYDLYEPYTFKTNFEALSEILYQEIQKDVILDVFDDKIRVLHRCTDDEDIYFVVNESARDFNGIIKLLLRNDGIYSVHRLDAETGDIYRIDKVVFENRYANITLNLDGYSSIVLRITKTKANNIISPVVVDTPIYKQILDFDWNITANGVSFKGPLKSIHKYGILDFSGEILYEASFELNNYAKPHRVFIEFRGVHDYLKFELNDEKIGARLWGPFKFDITDKVKDGNNKIVACVSNTLHNVYIKEINKLYQNIPEKTMPKEYDYAKYSNKPSGMLKPPVIILAD